MILPTVIFGAMFFGQMFPVTERVQMGVSVRPDAARDVLAAAVPALGAVHDDDRLGRAGVRYLAYPGADFGRNSRDPGAGLGVRRDGRVAPGVGADGPPLSSSGVLLCSAVVSGLGLIALSYADSSLTGLLDGTVLAAGVAYFWPTMIGTASERVPKGGAMALAVMGSVGAGAVGLIAIPLMGWVADQYVYQNLPVGAGGGLPETNRQGVCESGFCQPVQRTAPR